MNRLFSSAALLTSLCLLALVAFTAVRAKTNPSPTITARALATYAAFSADSLGERRAKYDILEARQKSELWRTHLSLYLNQHPELEGAQRDLILAAITLAGENLFASEAQAVRGEIAQLTVQVRQVFTPGEAKRVFATLGGLTSTSARFEDCSCSTLSDWCSSGYKCHMSTGGQCTVTEYGCGTFWLEACNGWCQIIVP